MKHHNIVMQSDSALLRLEYKALVLLPLLLLQVELEAVITFMSPTNSEPTVHKVYLENLHLENTVHVVLACQAFGVFVSLVFLVSSSVENKQIAQVLVVFLENHLFVIRVS